MIAIIVVLAFFGNGYQLQKKYDYCKSVQFKGEYCSLQKKLSEVKK